MNALKTGIDAQSQIITGEDPAALEQLTTQYYDRFQPQGPEEVALIDCAISADWLLRRFRKAEAEMWNRSIAEHEADLFKWGQKPEQFPVAAAFLDEQKAFDRLQRRISAAERSLRASLETLARLRKQISPHPNTSPLPPKVPSPPATPSKNDSLPEIGFVPSNSPMPSVPPAAVVEPPAEHPLSPGALPSSGPPTRRV